jgi:uncharacterized membrane protein YkvA (DUF1232 family)
VGDLPWWATALLVVLGIYALVLVALIALGRRWLAREAALLLPNLIRLFHGLLGDPAVPWHAKLALGAGIAYLAMPLDLIPDFIPVAGQLDDAVVAALVLAYVVRASGRPTVERHWRGDPRIIGRLIRQ